MKNYSIGEKILGVSHPQESEAVTKAYAHVTGKEIDEELTGEIDRLKSYDLKNWRAIPSHDFELVTTLLILEQIFNEGQIRYSNVLQHWPSYEAGYQQPTPNTEPRYALQLGCLTALSSAAFTALAQEVYKATPITIDLTASQERARYGHYIVGDALSLGFADSSMNLIQTNSLIHQLQSPGQNTKGTQQQVDTLAEEMYRVLAPGGQILLREIASQLDMSEHPTYRSPENQARIRTFNQQLVTSLARAGFTAITLEQATEIKGVDYLFNPDRDFTAYETYERMGTVAVSASKS